MGQTECIVMMTKEESTKNCQFLDPQDMGSCARARAYALFSENHVFL